MPPHPFAHFTLSSPCFGLLSLVLQELRDASGRVSTASVRGGDAPLEGQSDAGRSRQGLPPLRPSSSRAPSVGRSSHHGAASEDLESASDKERRRDVELVIRSANAAAAHAPAVGAAMVSADAAELEEVAGAQRAAKEMQAAAVAAARAEAERWDFERRTKVDEILVDRAATEVLATVADIIFKQALLQARTSPICTPKPSLSMSPELRSSTAPWRASVVVHLCRRSRRPRPPPLGLRRAGFSTTSSGRARSSSRRSGWGPSLAGMGRLWTGLDRTFS